MNGRTGGCRTDFKVLADFGLRRWALLAALLSAWLLLGLTGLAYAEGMAAIWVAIGCVTGILVLWIFLAEPLQKLTAKTEALTVPALFSKQFTGNNRSFGVLSSVIIIFFFILYG